MGAVMPTFFNNTTILVIAYSALSSYSLYLVERVTLFFWSLETKKRVSLILALIDLKNTMNWLAVSCEKSFARGRVRSIRRFC